MKKQLLSNKKRMYLGRLSKDPIIKGDWRRKSFEILVKETIQRLVDMNEISKE